MHVLIQCKPKTQGKCIQKKGRRNFMANSQATWHCFQQICPPCRWKKEDNRRFLNKILDLEINCF